MNDKAISEATFLPRLRRYSDKQHRLARAYLPDLLRALAQMPGPCPGRFVGAGPGESADSYEPPPCDSPVAGFTLGYHVDGPSARPIPETDRKRLIVMENMVGAAGIEPATPAV